MPHAMLLRESRVEHMDPTTGKISRLQEEEEEGYEKEGTCAVIRTTTNKALSLAFCTDGIWSVDLSSGDYELLAEELI